jgi:hypothetical protein
LRTCDPATASGLTAAPKPTRAASIAEEGAGTGAGAGGAAGASGAAEVWLTVDVVPVEVTESLDESMRATASWSFPDALADDAAVAEETCAERPDPLDEDDVVLSLLALTLCWVELAVPVGPVDPELPEMAIGLETAVDVAGPVLPVLVADDDEWTSPELPDWATGVSTTLGELPEPPLALAVPVELPPPLVAACAAGPSRATATAATPVAPAMQIPPASRAFLGFVIR